MRFVQNFTLPDFEAETFTPSISHHFNSFSDKTQKLSEKGGIYIAGKNFTLPSAVTGGTNLISVSSMFIVEDHQARCPKNSSYFGLFYSLFNCLDNRDN